MRKKLSEIAKYLDAELVGDRDIVITGVCGIKEAKEGDITFIANPRYLSLIDKTPASAIITSKDVKKSAKPIIRAEDPSYAFGEVMSWFFPAKTKHPKGIHKTAILGKKVELGKNVSLGAYAVIGDDVKIGDDTIIYSGSFVGNNSEIGKDCLIYPNVTIRERTIIGNRVIIHAGTAIGSDGFGFAKIKGVHRKIPQIGNVVIEDDVEIGSNVTIDRARFDKTIIGKGTKIDNLVQIAHNVIVGKNSIIVAQAGISGSTIIGNDVILAGQAGLVGHIKIGDKAVVGAQGGVTKSVPPGVFVSGYPARPHQEAMRVYGSTLKLPELIKTVARIEKKLAELDSRLKNGASKDNPKRS